MPSKSFWFRLIAKKTLHIFVDQGDDEMSIELHQSFTEENPYDFLDGVDNALIETIWHDLDKQLPRQRVSCVVAEVALGFQNATVKTFLPIFVHRLALDRLKQELNEITLIDGHLQNEQQ